MNLSRFLFEIADTDHSNTLDLKEIKTLFDKLPSMFNKDVKLKRIIERMDKNGEKGAYTHLNKEEFMEILEQFDQENEDYD